MLSPAVRTDLEQIWDYSSERWDDDQAEEYLREVQRAVERIVSNPTIGRDCNDVRSGYRKHKHAVGSHTLYYRIGGDDVIDVLRGFRFGGLELTQRTAHIGQRVPVLTGRTVLRRLRRLAGVGNRIPELSTGAIQRLCRTEPGAEERQGHNRSGRENGDGRAM